jgi:hypothetical protein
VEEMLGQAILDRSDYPAGERKHAPQHAECAPTSNAAPHRPGAHEPSPKGSGERPWSRRRRLSNNVGMVSQSNQSPTLVSLTATRRRRLAS